MNGLNKVALAFILSMGSLAMADDPQTVSDAKEKKANRGDEEIHVRTMGGRQLWGDLHFFRGWRIQHNVILGQHRLIDPEDRRYCSGTLDECHAELNRVVQKRSLPQMEGRAVLLIHGIGRSSKSFRSMASALETDDYTVVGFDYPSTRVPIEKSAEYLHSVIQSLDGIESIDVVCHSMGGLLLRSYLRTYSEPRFRRAVMLGVPNKGAQMADLLKRNPLFKAILGPAGQQLVTDQNGVAGQLPTPDFPFAIVAGGRSAAKGYNPILPGDNDSTVTVASTRLPGAADFILLPIIHSFLMNDKRSVEATRNFLKHGQLDPNRQPEPISRHDITVIE